MSSFSLAQAMVLRGPQLTQMQNMQIVCDKKKLESVAKPPPALRPKSRWKMPFFLFLFLYTYLVFGKGCLK